jgi:pimeloyl-ACP methyl ester carboxylesterase
LSAQNVREGYVEVDGARLYFQDRGSGSSIVFVHGWGLDLSYWEPVIERLSRRYRTVAYDSRGAGRSSGALPPYPLARLVEDLTAVVGHLGLQNAVLCGHSLGGDTVLQHGVTYPRAAPALVVADAPGPCDFWTSRFSYFGFKIILAISSWLGVSPAQKSLMPLFRDLLWSSGFQSSHPAVIRGWEEQFLAASLPGLLTSFRAMAYRKNLAAGIAVPTLLIRGTLDRLVPQRTAAYYQRRIAGSQLALIAGSGHMTLSEQPEVFSERVEAFFARVGIS